MATVQEIVTDPDFQALSPTDRVTALRRLAGDEVANDYAATLGSGPQDAVSRFLEPVGEAIRGAGEVPGALAAAGKATLQGNYGDIGPAVAMAVGKPMVAQAQQGGQDFNAGRYSEAFGHGAASLLPVVGPAAADIADTGTSGNVAGALGKAAVLGSSFVNLPFQERLASLLKNREAAQSIAVQAPTKARMAVTRGIAPEVFSGVRGAEDAGGLGIGTRAQLAAKAAERHAEAVKAVEGLQGLQTPVDPSPISANLRSLAAKRQTFYPPQQVTDAEGNALTLQPDPTSKNQPLVDAILSHADSVDKMAKDFGGQVPAGELFKSRATTNEALGNRAYEKLPGASTPTNAAADKMYAKAVSNFAHDEGQFGTEGLGGSTAIDHANHVWTKVNTNLQNALIGDQMPKAFRPIVGMLAKRLVGTVVGAAGGAAAGGGVGAVLGGALGGILTDSTFFNSLRATTYSKVAGLLRAGDLDGAADIIRQAATTYAISRAEQNRKAQDALSTQAQGSPAP